VTGGDQYVKEPVEGQEKSSDGAVVTCDAGRSSGGGAYHWREYNIQKLLPDPSDAKDVLLVGCGDGGERPYLHSLGYRTLAFDVRKSSAVDFLGDAHCLPVPDASFDIVLSMQVLEHLHSPWIAIHEMSRVLRPGGFCLGSVAFLKPFHASYFHMSHQGISELLGQAGLEVETIHGAQSLTYSMLGAMLPLGSRSLRRALLGALDGAILALRAFIWSLTRRLDANEPLDRFATPVPTSFRQFDRLRFAPAVVFRGRKRTRGVGVD
jgi:SAM-dependent methyltransferase